MALSDLANVVVSRDGAGLKQVGFGVMMLASYHTRFAERQRLYAELSEMISDGFTTGDAAYKMAAAAIAATPRVQNFRIGRLALAYTQTIRWIPTDTTAGYVQTLSIEYLGVKYTATYTNGGGATVATIIDNMLIAVQALDDLDAHITVTDGTTYMQIASGSGKLMFYSAWTGKYEDRTADPGVATDLAAIQLENNDWYGVATDLQGRIVQEEVADWAEPAKKLAPFVSSDWQAKDDTQTVDIGFVLTGKAYAYSFFYFDNGRDTGEYENVRAMGERFPSDPGQPPGAGGTWHGKTLPGLTFVDVTPAEKTALKDKNYNVYTETATRKHTLYGVTASGEYIDVVRFIDWNNIRMQEAQAFTILSAEKIPYTDGGVSTLLTQVSKVLDTGVAAGGWTPDPYPKVSALPVAQVSTGDKAARTYNGISWEATLAGAIHLNNIRGQVHV